MMTLLESLWQRRTVMMIVTLTLALTMREMMTDELGMTLRRIQRRFPREMPLRSNRQFRRFHRRRCPTRWSSPRPPEC
jgi:hypothetical protein